MLRIPAPILSLQTGMARAQSLGQVWPLFGSAEIGVTYAPFAP